MSIQSVKVLFAFDLNRNCDTLNKNGDTLKYYARLLLIEAIRLKRSRYEALQSLKACNAGQEEK